MFDSILQFLKDPANLAILGSIGAVIAAIAGGAWAVFTYFDKKNEKSLRRRTSPPIMAASPLAETSLRR